MDNHSHWNTVWQRYQSINKKKLARTYDMVDFDALSRDARILDLGCGSGEFLSLLEERGFQNIEGWEPQHDLVGMDSTGRVKVGTCLDNQEHTSHFDVIVMIGVLHHLLGFDEVKRCIKNLHVMLKHGGVFVSVEPVRSVRRSIATWVMTTLPPVVLPEFVKLERTMYLEEEKEFNQWLGYEGNVTSEFLRSGFAMQRFRKDWRYRYCVFQKALPRSVPVRV